MPRRIAIAATGLIVAVTIVARAQPERTANDSRYSERLDAALQRLVSEDGVPGVAVGIVDEGRVVYANGFGVARLAEPTHTVTRDTVFHVASVTKTFVATVVMQLVERRQLPSTLRSSPTFPTSVWPTRAPTTSPSATS